MPSGVAVARRYSHVANGNSAFQVIDVTDPSHLKSVGSVAASDFCMNVVVLGKYAYALGASTDIYDLTNPAKPQKLANFRTSGSAQNWCMQGTIGYAIHSRGITAVDLTDPTRPKPMSQKDGFDARAAIAVNGAICVAANQDGLLVLEPAAARSRDDLQIIDITDPAHPRGVGSFPTGGGQSVAVQSNYLYVADGRSGLLVIDVTTPSQPNEVGSFWTSGAASDIVLSGNFAFLTDGGTGGGGLYILDVSDLPQRIDIRRKQIRNPSLVRVDDWWFVKLAANPNLAWTLTSPQQGSDPCRQSQQR